MRFIRAVICVGLLTGAVAHAQQPPQPQRPPGQEEFVPLSEIPAEEQIPAFTLVAAAYAFVWLVLAGYVWSVARRLEKVESDVTAISRSKR